MSAYMVDREHVRFLVNAALDTCGGRHHSAGFTWYHAEAGGLRELHLGDLARAAQVGQMLWNENRRSIEARYPDTAEDFSNAPGVVGEDYDYDKHHFDIQPPLSDDALWFAVISACNCFEYQACEHGEWEASEAHTFVQALKKAAIANLSGMDDAPWGAPKPGRSIEQIEAAPLAPS